MGEVGDEDREGHVVEVGVEVEAEVKVEIEAEVEVEVEVGVEMTLRGLGCHCSPRQVAARSDCDCRFMDRGQSRWVRARRERKAHECFVQERPRTRQSGAVPWWSGPDDDGGDSTRRQATNNS